jgi:RNA polymerase sigma-70 factor (ECF subfamily)
MSVALAMESLATIISQQQGACMAEIAQARRLTSAIASGDRQAFADFYRAWFDFALREAQRCSGRDEQFCLDVVQETMLRVIRRMKPLDSDAAIAAWLKTAIRSACIDLLRRDQRQRRRDQRHSLTIRERIDDTAAQGDTRERLKWLRAELAVIEPDSARALDMRFRLGWTLARIGKALHLRNGAVDGRINRALARLRAAAQEDQHE